MYGVVNEQRRSQHTAHLDDEHHRVLCHAAGIKLAECIHKRVGHDFGIPKTFLFKHDSPFRD